jgi:hypothetical protein
MIRSHRLITTLLAIASISWPARAWPCAPAPITDAPPFGAKTENALIVWDRERHIEHFVRNAVFGTGAQSFGFLVPVPGRPVLSEASDGVFDVIDRAIPYRTEFKTSVHRDPFGCAYLALMDNYDWSGKVGAGAPDSRPGVTVLDATRVAGLDATVLSATDTTALSDWLGSRGFQPREALKRWLAVYVAKQWNIVAFRYARPAVAPNSPVAADSLASRAVRISFPTPEPIYPYLEPDDAPETKDRWLHLYVAADTPMDAVLVDDRGSPWGAKRVSATRVDLHNIASALPGLELVPGVPWVTEFVDNVTRRKASDLVFRANRSLAPAERVEVQVRYQTGIPYVSVELLCGVALLTWWWRGRARKKPAAAEA